MTPFERATLNDLTPEQKQNQIKWMQKHRPWLTPEQADQLLEDIKTDIIWVNDKYQVNVRQLKGPDDIWVTHLSIKLRTKEVVHDWRDLQDIKNELTDPECEALEIYPAESRLVDTANQYHLWVLPKGVLIPFGFHEGRVVDYDTADAESTGAKQRGK